MVINQTDIAFTERVNLYSCLSLVIVHGSPLNLVVVVVVVQVPELGSGVDEQVDDVTAEAK